MSLTDYSMSDFIPISKPSISELEIEYVNDAVRSTWISSLGKYIDRFEEEFAAFCDCKYAISVFNGTVAIHLSLIANGIGPGHEVIVPDLSFIATANAVLHAGATPVFIDIDPFTLCIDPLLIERAITNKTKAIIPVHLYGHPADMIVINQIALKYDLVIIEDAAESHGATLVHKKVGSWGKCGTFSFYGNKNMTTGEGGMITTNDRNLYEKCRFLRDHAMSKEKRYWHTEPGYNYRMTNLQAALGCAQLTRIEYFLKRRNEIFESYQSKLSGHPDIHMNRTAENATNSYWLICVEVDGLDYNARDNVLKRMRDLGVDTRPYFYPMSHMPYFMEADTPVSRLKSNIGFNLPTFTEITDREIHKVVKALIQSI
jgi:perosamine synthetase